MKMCYYYYCSMCVCVHHSVTGEWRPILNEQRGQCGPLGKALNSTCLTHLMKGPKNQLKEDCFFGRQMTFRRTANPKISESSKMKNIEQI